MHHNTYNLKSILQSDLDPNLCKLMLHEIKSPLLEHSFQLTTDDEYQPASFTSPVHGHSPNNTISHNNSLTHYTQRHNNNQSYSYLQNNARLDEMSIAQSKFEQTIINKQSPIPNRTYSLDNYSAQKQLNKQQTNFILDELNQQMVSPLQYYQAKGKTQQKNQFKDLVRQTQNNDKAINNAVAGWCGDLFDNKHTLENQIVFENERGYIRKKIFNNHHNSKKNTQNANHRRVQSYYTFVEAVRRLNEIRQYEVSRFVEFVGNMLLLLKKTAPHRENLHKNQDKVYRMLITQNPVDHETEETIANKNKIINRLRIKKMSEALAKICNFQQITSNAYAIYKEPQQFIRTDINIILQYLSEVEDIVETYVSRKDAVIELHKIYNLLYDREIKMLNKDENNLQFVGSRASQINATSNTPSPISTLKNTQTINKQDNIGYNTKHIKSQLVSPKSSRAKPIVEKTGQCRYQQSLKQKIYNLLYSLKINPQLYHNITDLNYIWSEFSNQGSYSPISWHKYKIQKQKFVNILCKNDILIHEAARGIVDLSIEKKLTEMGFTRNSQ